MSVGPLHGLTTTMHGNVTVTLYDGDNQVRAVQNMHNQISMLAVQVIGSALGAGTGVAGRYIYIFSAANMALTQSMLSPTSTGTVVGLPNGPVTATWNPATYIIGGTTAWAFSGTYTFSGHGNMTSVDAAALMIQATAPAGTGATAVSNSWIAQVSFADLAITSVDKLTFVWIFSLSTTTSV